MHEMGRWQKDSAEDPRYYIRGSVLAGFAELVTAAGGDPAALLEKAGFSLEVPALQDELVSWTRLCLLLERAAETLDRPSLGIEWALSVPDHFPNVGPTLLLANFAGTFQEWIEASITYWRHHTNAFALQLVDDGPGHDAVFRHVLLSPALPMRQHAEYMLGNACRMARAMGGLIHRNPSQVRFRHQKPADTSLHEAIFGCPVTFGASHDDIVFDRRLLSLPLRGTPGRLRKVMDLHIRHRWRQMPLRDDTMATTVGLAIRSVMGTKLCSCGLVAGSLGLRAKKSFKDYSRTRGRRSRRSWMMCGGPWPSVFFRTRRRRSRASRGSSRIRRQVRLLSPSSAGRACRRASFARGYLRRRRAKGPESELCRGVALPAL